MKILFMGTPDFAKIQLEAMIGAGYSIRGVVTQPDKPAGRGGRITRPPVKVMAEGCGIAVYQPRTLRGGEGGMSEEAADMLRETAPDIIVVAAYGKILPAAVLDYPALGCICVHASLLPKYRGAAPIQRAIIDGEEVSGVTIMYMDEGIDTGAMLLRRELPILRGDDFGTYHDKLAVAGAEALIESLGIIKAGDVKAVRQNDALASYAHKITNADCMIDFTRRAEDIFNQIRGLSPTPLAFTHAPGGKLLKISKAEVIPGSPNANDPGSITAVDKTGITVACGDNALLLREVVPEGKSKMSASDYARGKRILVGERMG